MVHEKRQGGAPASAEASTAETSEPQKKGKNSLSQLILQAFETCNPTRKGLSLAALKKFLTESGYNLHRNNGRLKKELNNLVSSGLLTRITGSGASGSFKFSGAQARKKKTTTTGKQKKTAAKKAARKKEPKKKPRKKQPAVSKPKGLKGKKTSAAAPVRKQRQPNKLPTANPS